VERLKPGEEESDDVNGAEDLAVDLTNAMRLCGELRYKLAEIAIDPTEEAVYWIERDMHRASVSLRAAPLHVGPFLQERLFDRLRTAVLTSATLTTDGGFEYVRERLGLETARELSVASPFDYERSTLLYLVDDIPEPNAPGYQRDLQDILVELGMALGGKTLVLFTSHAALQATYRAIKMPLEDRGIVVLAQRSDGSARQLIERLKHSENVMLLGTSTFWEGVDVVGPALSALVIAKLPFAVPSDPVFAARGESFDEPFQQYAVPQAVLKFKQGFGRLIRSGQDRGVCAVLDRRVISKRYGASFVQSLPSCTVEVAGASDLPAAAVAWLESVPTGR
jgi:DNA polymerase-3 subunit epsilon/ATP-dependent DNA helicase DinG